MDLTTIIGIAGALVILIAFILNETDRLKNSDFLYDFLNFAGSVLLFAYAMLLNSIPFLILNLVWAAVSFRDLFRKRTH